MKLRIICPTNAAKPQNIVSASTASSQTVWVTWFRVGEMPLHAVAAPAVQAAVKTELSITVNQTVLPLPTAIYP